MAATNPLASTTAAPATAGRRWLWPAARFVLVGIVLAWIARRSDWSVFQGVDWALLGPRAALAGSLVVLAQLVSALRWRRLAASAGMSLPLWSAFVVNYVGTFFNSFVLGSQGGDLVRLGLTLRAQPDRRGEAGAILLADRVIGLMGLVVLVLALTGLTWAALTPVGRAAAGLAAIIMGLGLVCFWGALMVPIEVLPVPAVLKRPSVLAAQASLRGLLRRPRVVLEALLLSVGVNGLCLVAVALCADGLGMSVAPLSVGWGAGATMLANVVPLTPGNLGVTEAISDEVFRALGATTGAPLFALYRVVCALASLPAFALFLADAGGVRPQEPAKS